jgi:membrane protein implicated in regulation of membrane protease activity
MKRHHCAVAATALSALAPAAGAYVGPGAGLGLLGALWALIAALGAALIFVLLWPLRRLRQRRRDRVQQSEAVLEDGAAAAADAEPQRPAAKR